MKTYKNNYWRENYKTFIADIHISTTENNSDTLGNKTAAAEVLVLQNFDVGWFLTVTFQLLTWLPLFLPSSEDT